MRAKEILNLYENNTITGSEFYEQYRSYFIKKMKSIGAVEIGGSGRQVKIILGEGYNFKTLTDKIVWKYGRELLKLIKNSEFIKYSNGFRINVYCNGDDFWGKNDEFLVIDYYSFTRDSWVLPGRVFTKIEISLSEFIEDSVKYVNRLIPKDFLKTIYLRVDEIVKAIRLVPFGG